MLKEFFKRLFGLSKDAQTLEYNPNLFASIDVDKAADQLRIIVSAQDDGRAEVPSSGEQNLCASEANIINFFEEEALSVSRKVTEKIQTYTHEIKTSKLESAEGTVASAFDNFRAAIGPLISEHRSHLTALKTREDVARDEVIAFRHANRIARPATYPDSSYFLLAILFLILIGEASLNGVFFAKGSEFGLVGGISQAFMTAGINIAVAWMIGRFLIPQLNHFSTIRKVIGALSVLIFIVWAACYNLFVGHFRDAISSSLDVRSGTLMNVSADVIDNMISAPLRLQDFDSWLLVVLGIVFAVIAVLDGYKFDDPYPGYGAVTRRLEVAGEEYSDDKQSLLQELATTKDLALQNLDELDDTVVATGKSINDFMTLANRMSLSFKSYLAEIDGKANLLLKQYRDANQKVRKTDMPPYFSQDYHLKDNTPIRLPELPEQKRVATQLKKVKQIRAKIQHSRISIQDEYSNRIDGLQEEFRILERV